MGRVPVLLPDGRRHPGLSVALLDVRVLEPLGARRQSAFSFPPLVGKKVVLGWLERSGSRL